MVTSTTAVRGSSPCSTIWPSKLLKRPLTLVIIMCLATNSMLLCAGSNFQVDIALSLRRSLVRRKPDMRQLFRTKLTNVLILHIGKYCQGRAEIALDDGSTQRYAGIGLATERTE